MNQAKTLLEFKQALEPYLFFWDKWVLSEDCNLNPSEIEIIDFYQKTNFESSIIGSIIHHDKAKQIPYITEKLTSGYQVFKSIVVVNFLCTLVQYAKTYPGGYNSFLTTAICELKIPPELITCLLSFKTHNIHHLVTFYREEEFSGGLIYKKIVEFQVLKKRSQIKDGFLNLV